MLQMSVEHMFLGLCQFLCLCLGRCVYVCVFMRLCIYICVYVCMFCVCVCSLDRQLHLLPVCASVLPLFLFLLQSAAATNCSYSKLKSERMSSRCKTNLAFSYCTLGFWTLCGVLMGEQKLEFVILIEARYGNTCVVVCFHIISGVYTGWTCSDSNCYDFL